MKTALEIASQIRNSESTVFQAVEEHIALIEKANPLINAVVEKRYDEALQEARHKDEILLKLDKEERRNLPPLFGVPFTCKEMIANQGMKSTLGSYHRRDQVMDHDATVVNRVKAAGAVLLGTTNVPEVGFWFECDNVIYGSTKNPYDLKRTSGGSSGGEGAIISVGASAFGLGSDLGGSVRLPAAFCGIFGHKPSDRIVPLTGHHPLYQNNANEIVSKKYPFTVIGPLARSVADLETLLKLMVGSDEFDQNIKQDFILKPLIHRAEDLRIFYIPSPVIHATTETEEDLAQTVKHAARYLREMGSTVSEMNHRTFIRAADLWAARTYSVESQSFIDYLSDSHPVNLTREFLRLMTGQRNYTLPSLLTSVVDRYAADKSEVESNMKALQELKESLTRQLGKNGVLLMPVHPRKAPLLNSTYTRPFDFSYTGIINALGFPATAVPMGLSKEGLPLSLQVIAAEDQDHLCLSVAQMLETGFGGWQVPQLKNP